MMAFADIAIRMCPVHSIATPVFTTTRPMLVTTRIIISDGKVTVRSFDRHDLIFVVATKEVLEEEVINVPTIKVRMVSDDIHGSLWVLALCKFANDSSIPLCVELSQK